MCLYNNNNQNAQVGKENKQGDCLDEKNCNHTFSFSNGRQKF